MQICTAFLPEAGAHRLDISLEDGDGVLGNELAGVEVVRDDDDGHEGGLLY